MIVPTFLFKIDGTGGLLEILGTDSVIVKFTLWGCYGNLQEKCKNFIGKIVSRKISGKIHLEIFLAQPIYAGDRSYVLYLKYNLFPE
jgi:hypothetical protein